MASKNQQIYDSHRYRMEYLEDVMAANLSSYDYHCQELSLGSVHVKEMELSERIKGDELRSSKNHMISLNSMSCLMAEYGGMDAVLSHYLAEKYAILIEEARSISLLEKILQEFVHEYLNPSNRPAYNKSMPLDKRIDYYIENNFMVDINVQEIADYFNFSREYLSRSYKRATGKTIQDKLETTRIEEGKRFLKESSLSITEIALLIGYNSSQYFAKVFKKATGQSPSNYRKNRSV